MTTSPAASTSTPARSFGAGPDVTDELQQPIDADPGESGADENGPNRGGIDPFVQRRLQFGNADLLAVEVLRQQIIGELDDVLDEVFVVGVLAVGSLRWQFVGLDRGAGVVEEGVLGEQVGDPVELGFLTDRQLDRFDAGTEVGLAAVRPCGRTTRASDPSC